MAEYMGEYKIIRRMDGGGNVNVFVAENARLYLDGTMQMWIDAEDSFELW